MKDQVTKITYTDEVMADKTVCRRFSDGRTEWRSRLDKTRVAWRDDRFDEGVDELLGDGILKRTHGDGHLEYGREQGFGRTAWKEGRELTVNETSLGGRVGKALTAAGSAALLGALVPPPAMLTPGEEEELRHKAAATREEFIDSAFDLWGEDDDEGGDAGDAGDSDFG